MAQDVTLCWRSLRERWADSVSGTLVRVMRSVWARRAVVVVAVLALSAVSLRWDAIPQFDPQGWLLWGREVTSATLSFSTLNYPSWKPLPALITMPLGLTGEAAVPLWLVLVRASSLLAVGLAYRLGRRLGGRAAGALAAGALLCVPEWLRFTIQGFSEPLLVALLLLSLERLLAGHPREALAAAVLAGLDRPEAWPLAALLAWVVWRTPSRARGSLRLVALGAVLALLPLAWLGGDWLGSGDPFHAGRLARHAANALETRQPGPIAHTLDLTRALIGLPVALGALAAVGVGLRRRESEVLIVAAAALGWLAAELALVAAGFPTDARFLLPVAALGCVLAASGAARLPALTSHRALAATLAVGLAAASTPWAVGAASGLVRQARSTLPYARAVSTLDHLVHSLRPDAILACGQPGITHTFQTRLAWDLHTNTREVRFRHPPGLLFVRAPPSARQLVRYIGWRADPELERVAQQGKWSVYIFASTVRRSRPRRASAPSGAHCHFPS